ncbi:MAG: ABC transporter ATP-binding protein/permease [Actinomycetota bacterium]|nr:ABC transporter ATP-binding protein/permease [Actinomycetota bacterium]
MVVAIVVMGCGGVVPGLALRALLQGGGMAWMIVLGGSALVPLVTGVLWDYYQRGLMLRASQAATEAVMAASLAPAGIDHLESPRYADAMQAVRANTRTPALLFDWMATALAEVVSVGAAAAVLAGVHPLLMLPMAAAAALGVAQAGTRRRALVYLDHSLPGQRLTARLAELGTTPGPAKEVRTLALGPWLLERHHAETGDVARRLVRGERGPVVGAAASGLVQAALLVLGVGWLVRLAATGRATTGDVALGVVALRAAVDQAASFGMTIVADLATNTHVARRYLWLLDYRPQLKAAVDPVPVPERLHHGVALEAVTFRYEGCDRPALDNVSVRLPAGTTVALVGDNGTGKSTLVKLLCRFYDPQEGRVTVDGVDVRKLDLDAWRAACSGAFQDFVRFRFLAQESVGLGAVEAVDDLGRVRAAALAGQAAPFLERLPAGFRTQLGREFPGGADLSEGQWQKVALSRSLMRANPLLVLLDEPTAALDARAEHALFERYAAQAEVARQRGGITVLVSHRFSTVRMADLIVVLDAGRVVETGSHDELMACSGRYAEMFRLQAARYR